MPRLSLAKLERHLYAAADRLRQEGLDAATYKDYIFGMLFLKRVIGRIRFISGRPFLPPLGRLPSTHRPPPCSPPCPDLRAPSPGPLSVAARCPRASPKLPRSRGAPPDGDH